MVPAGTGRDRDFPEAAAGRATSDPRHIRVTTPAILPALTWMAAGSLNGQNRSNDLHIFGRRFSDDVRRVF
jgi:hypothetical protein